MMRRALAITGLAATLATSCSGAFATVTLLVREPVDGDARREETNTNLLFSVDGEEAASVSIQAGQPLSDLESAQLPLTDTARTLVAGISVGNLDVPVAIGFSDPIVIPKVADVENGVLGVEAPAILAAPDRAELLDPQRPTPRAQAAVCMAPSGKGWVMGGFGIDDDADLENGYAFGLDELLAKDTVLTDLVPGQMACDSDGGERFVLVETGCAADGTGAAPGDLRLSIGTDQREDEAALEGGCNPSISVVGNTAWIVTDGHIEARAVDTLARIAHVEQTFTGALVVGIDENRAFVARLGGADVNKVFTISGATLVEADATAAEVVAVGRTASGAYVLKPDGRVAPVEDNTLGTDRLVSEPTTFAERPELAFLRDGRAVVLTATALHIEQGAKVLHDDRDGMGVTVGGAVLLAGGAQRGIDVVVPTPVE